MEQNRRFFSDTSFWNLPVPADPQIDPDSDVILKQVSLVSRSGGIGFWIGMKKWTVPVYEASGDTPLRRVHQRTEFHFNRFRYHHGRDFDPLVPIPDGALADPEGDGHLAVVDWERGRAWDMWAARKRSDGEWESNTGMTYDPAGSGVFDRSQFAICDGESIHGYGPSRASGVPAIAGLIMRHEIAAGKIEHKLACATQCNAYRRFVHPPACWTDGPADNGLPEGATIQLDPSLDLTAFNLTPGGMAVARALQRYGAVCVDHCGGHTLYAEGLYGKKQTWDGLLSETDVRVFSLDRFRVLKIKDPVLLGHGVFRQEYLSIAAEKGIR